MMISSNCINMVAKWEGFYSKAYKCPAGIWTIGFGTTVWENGKRVQAGEHINRERALKLLKLQVQQHASTIPHYVKRPLTQNQYDALASFQYNLGKHILAKNSTLLNALNKGDWKTATDHMLLYNKARVNGKLTVLKGLSNRRKDEVSLFLKTSTTSKPKPTNSTNNSKKYDSIVDYLKSKGQSYDMAARKKLATKYGIKNYRGTADQNIKLLAILQK